MRTHFLRWIVAIMASTALTALLIAQAQQGGAPAPATKGKGKGPVVPTGPAPRLADGKPDFSGVWMGGGSGSDIAQGLPKGEKLPMLPATEKKYREAKQGDDPEANCLPTGVPRMAPYPWRMVQTPTHIFMLFEGNIHSFRQIFMDGRKHPAGDDLDPTWYGHSIGSWDGDTLVVDTIGYNDKFWFDFRGHQHTEQLHTIERWTRKDMGTLTNVITIEDPGAYSKPFTATFSARLMPAGTELMEYICQENEKDAKHIVGLASESAPPGR